MGFSFGYNQNEDSEDYNSPKALVLMLVNIVSTGGNLLLDIGPDSRGRIPVIMQERLRQMGKWLSVNGEAIYNTIPWNNSFQWSNGERDFKPKQHYLGGDFILQQTVDPEPGYAVKELFFTQTDDAYYVIAPKWTNKQITIKDFKPNDSAKVVLLVTGEEIDWKQQGKNMVLDIPVYDPNKIDPEDDYAYVFKILK
jgi:alpha-L-fucosidase